VANIGMHGTENIMSPVALFMQADLVVKSVMIGLILASIWTWAIIIAQWLKMRRIRRANERFEQDFWKTDDIDKFYEARGREELPASKVFAAGIGEWRRSTSGTRIDKDGTRSRLSVAMHSAVSAEVDQLAHQLNILATVGRSHRSLGCSAPCGASCAAFLTLRVRRTPALPS
jgi:biopolymer transport protein TolQ